MELPERIIVHFEDARHDAFTQFIAVLPIHSVTSISFFIKLIATMT